MNKTLSRLTVEINSSASLSQHYPSPQSQLAVLVPLGLGGHYSPPVSSIASRWTMLLTRSPEWIKGLLAVPFVLYSQPQGVFEGQGFPGSSQAREEAHRRYSEILRDVEIMIDDHSRYSTISYAAKLNTYTNP
jgi:hypothetical protein